MNKDLMRAVASIPDAIVYLAWALFGLFGWFIFSPVMLSVVTSILTLGVSLIVTARLQLSSSDRPGEGRLWVPLLRSFMFPLLVTALMLATVALQLANPEGPPIYMCFALPAVALVALQVSWYWRTRRNGK